MTRKILKPAFFRRKALLLAPDLLGKFIVREKPDGTQMSAMITETEAYAGVLDLASHSSKGLTERTRALFEAGGVWYVYFIYGLHYMLNTVAGKKGDGEAVLIRGVLGARGPGRVAKLFQVGKKDYARTISPESGLFIEDRGIVLKKNDIVRSTRIGIDYSGPIWSGKKFRFYIKS